MATLVVPPPARSFDRTFYSPLAGKWSVAMLHTNLNRSALTTEIGHALLTEMMTLGDRVTNSLPDHPGFWRFALDQIDACTTAPHCH